MKNLVIIGNGFDLAHEIETGYPQFFNYLLEKVKTYSDNGQLIVDKGLGLPHLNLEDVKNSLLEAQRTIVNPIFRSLIEMEKENWYDVEQIYFNSLNARLDNMPSVTTLNKSFSVIRQYLIDYLKGTIEKHELEAKQSFADFFSILEKDALILSFNYTPTLKCYSKELKRKTICHFHGNLDYPEGIIFGYSPNETEYQKLLSKNVEEPLNFIKQPKYKLEENEDDLFSFLESDPHINVTCIGHSLGKSDHDILNLIFSHSNVKDVFSFFHENENRYIQLFHNFTRRVEAKRELLAKFKPIGYAFQIPVPTDKYIEQTYNMFKSSLDNFRQHNKM